MITVVEMTAHKLFNVQVWWFQYPGSCLSVSPTSLMCCTHVERWNSAHDHLENSLCGRGQGTWPGRKWARTRTHCLSQITWTIRSFKRISQWEVAALESHAPDGYWSILSLHTDTHAEQAAALLSSVINKLVTLLFHFSVLSVVGGSPLQSCDPLNSDFSAIF